MPDFQFTLFQYAIAITCALIFGISKAGIKGIGIIAVPLMAIAFGGKASTGIVLPLLMMGDIFAVWYYNRHAEWKYLRQLLPWVIIGVLIGVYVGNELPEAIFKPFMGVVIIGSVISLFWWDRRRGTEIPTHRGFAILMGLAVGFTTMVGNLAGAFANLFFLTMRLPKNNFIGTAAWLFFIVNWFKVPFHIWVWGTITWETVQLNLWLLPGIVLGVWLGIKLVKLIKDHWYRQLILWMTLLGAVLLLI
ncbi:MAG: sulfite exporter TauE/SafE family protein [Saprospiraceae bacterium]